MKAGKALHAVVRGRVQGVGFRMFVERRAEALGLAGWVRNLPNGNVETWAEGDEGALQAFLADLHKGPALARVTNVDVAWEAPKGESEFQVRE